MRFVILITTMIFLTSCATGYHPDGFGGGYSEVKYSRDTVKITFRGNGYTSSSRVQDYVLLRAADYTTSNKYEFFYILNSNGEKSNQLIQTSEGQIQYNQFSNSATYSGPTYMNVSKSTESLLIKMSHEYGTGALNASELKNNLAKSLGVTLETANDLSERNPSSSYSLPPEVDTSSSESEGDYWSKKSN